MKKIYLEPYCRICKQPALRVRVCGGEQHKFVFCDACNAAYAHPNLQHVYQAIPQNAEQKCPKCDANLAFGDRHETSHWAVEQEIIDEGWDKFIFYPR